MTEDDARHGTEAGFEQHKRDGEAPCGGCDHAKLIASRRRSKRRAMGWVFTVPASPHVARLRIWRDGGASYGDIADHVGIEEGRAWELLNEPPPVIYTRTAEAIMAARGWPLTPLGITRRIQALTRMGFSAQRLAREFAVDVDTVMDATEAPRRFVTRRTRLLITEGYERLAMQIPDALNKQEKAGITRAKNRAIKNGWPPPFAWDDIDDPTVEPQWGGTDTDMDPVVVMRLLEGRHIEATRQEREEAIRRWVLDGGTKTELCNVHGWEPGRYGRTSPLRLVGEAS